MRPGVRRSAIHEYDDLGGRAGSRCFPVAATGIACWAFSGVVVIALVVIKLAEERDGGEETW